MSLQVNAAKRCKEYSNPIWTVAFNPEGSLLASGSEDSLIRVWDIGTRQCRQVLRGHSNAVRSVAFSPDGGTLATSSEDHTIRLWDVSTGCCRQIIQESGRVWTIAFSSKGTTLASCTDDQVAKLWDVATGQVLKIFQGHSGENETYINLIIVEAANRFLILSCHPHLAIVEVTIYKLKIGQKSVRKQNLSGRKPVSSYN